LNNLKNSVPPAVPFKIGLGNFSWILKFTSAMAIEKEAMYRIPIVDDSQIMRKVISR